jgi:hypothetical protein
MLIKTVIIQKKDIYSFKIVIFIITLRIIKQFSPLGHNNTETLEWEYGSSGGVPA